LTDTIAILTSTAVHRVQAMKHLTDFARTIIEGSAKKVVFDGRIVLPVIVAQ